MNIMQGNIAVYGCVSTDEEPAKEILYLVRVLRGHCVEESEKTAHTQYGDCFMATVCIIAGAVLALGAPFLVRSCKAESPFPIEGICNARST